MCLLVLAWKARLELPVVIAANRDEYHDRPAAPLARWEGRNGFIAGRDLRAGGAWFGVGEHHRFAFVTNFSEGQRAVSPASSRGELVRSFLARPYSADEFVAALEARALEYAGFNLIVADHECAWYASNRERPFARPLPPGVYGLGNQVLDAASLKLSRVRNRFEAWLKAPEPAGTEELFMILADMEPTLAAEQTITDRPDLELALSAPFVKHATFGTRCSTIALLDSAGVMRVVERSFDSHGGVTREVSLSV